MGPWKGWLWFKPAPRWWQCIVWSRGDHVAYLRFTEEEHEEVEKKQARRPCYLGHHRQTDKHYWQYHDEFFACDEKFKADVIAGFYEKRSATKAARIQRYEAIGKEVRSGKNKPASKADVAAVNTAVDALIKLGFNKSRSTKAIMASSEANPEATSETLVKEALARLRAG